MPDGREQRNTKPKKTPKHECTVILLDVGSNMAHPVRDTSTPAIFYAKEIVDWVLTRKVGVPSLFTIVGDEI